MIEQAIKDRLSAVAGLAALVQSRIFPTTPPENAQLPMVIYRVSQSEPVRHLTGASSLSRHVVEADCWAINADTALQVATQVRAALHSYRGGSIQGSFLQTQLTEEEELGYHALLTFDVWADNTASALAGTVAGQDYTFGNLTANNATVNNQITAPTVRVGVAGDANLVVRGSPGPLLTVQAEAGDGMALEVKDSGGPERTFAVMSTGELRTNQTDPATTLGSVTKRLPIYNPDGTLLGYIPVYNTIT
jgi:hypothetical protein